MMGDPHKDGQNAREPHPGGRPKKMVGGRRVNLYLDAESLAIAARLGKGNLSSGIRKALASATLLVEDKDK